MTDLVNHPPHYNSHSSGIEVIEITRSLEFTLGNAVKYILRHAHKDNPKQDIDKAIWYVKDIIGSDKFPYWTDDSADAMVEYLVGDRRAEYDDSLGAPATGAIVALLAGKPETALVYLERLSSILA